jgi:hypothetical protein
VIGLAAATNIIQAARFAFAIDLPLNRFVTINWATSGAASGFNPTSRFLKLAGDWLSTNGVVRTWIWTREAGHHTGEHVHIAMHVPPSLGREFGNRQRAWAKTAGARWWTGTIKTRPVGRSSSHAFHGVQYGERYEDHLRMTVEYLLKGTSADTAAVAGLAISRVPGGRIAGKRAGTSANIGASARTRLNEPANRAFDHLSAGTHGDAALREHAASPYTTD